jgi:hypothetical protein
LGQVSSGIQNMLHTQVASQLNVTDFLSTAYRREAQLGGCVYKKQLDLFWQKLTIIQKRAMFKF